MSFVPIVTCLLRDKILYKKIFLSIRKVSTLLVGYLICFLFTLSWIYYCCYLLSLYAFKFNTGTFGSVKVERDKNYALNLSCFVKMILFCFQYYFFILCHGLCLFETVCSFFDAYLCISVVVAVSKLTIFYGFHFSSLYKFFIWFYFLQLMNLIQ